MQLLREKFGSQLLKEICVSSFSSFLPRIFDQSKIIHDSVNNTLRGFSQPHVIIKLRFLLPFHKRAEVVFFQKAGLVTACVLYYVSNIPDDVTSNAGVTTHFSILHHHQNKTYVCFFLPCCVYAANGK